MVAGGIAPSTVMVAVAAVVVVVVFVVVMVVVVGFEGLRGSAAVGCLGPSKCFFFLCTVEL